MSNIQTGLTQLNSLGNFICNELNLKSGFESAGHSANDTIYAVFKITSVIYNSYFHLTQEDSRVAELTIKGYCDILEDKISEEINVIIDTDAIFEDNSCYRLQEQVKSIIEDIILSSVL
jgi:hypothetical protein